MRTSKPISPAKLFIGLTLNIKMDIIYQIGDNYHYPGCKKQFKLISVTKWMFVFECGKRVTDNVFLDMIHTKTKIQVYQQTQLSLNFN